MRLITFDDGDGPRAGVLLGEHVVPVSALDPASRSVRQLLGTLDAGGLAELGERASAVPDRIQTASAR